MFFILEIHEHVRCAHARPLAAQHLTPRLQCAAFEFDRAARVFLRRLVRGGRVSVARFLGRREFFGGWLAHRARVDRLRCRGRCHRRFGWRGDDRDANVARLGLDGRADRARHRSHRIRRRVDGIDDQSRVGCCVPRRLDVSDGRNVARYDRPEAIVRTIEWVEEQRRCGGRGRRVNLVTELLTL